MSALTGYVAKVAAYAEETRATFVRLYRRDVITHPVPFFGDVESAQVLTVGVNPSAGEFVDREWPATMTPVVLVKRRKTYFGQAPAPPHPWFATWTAALAWIDLSYGRGAAHIDISPRATVAMGTHSDWFGFAEMVESDAKWFFELLPLCQAARALLIAGCVTERWYINDFIGRVACRYGYQFTGQAESTGEGRVGFYHLTGPGCNLPVFFCSVSPSGNKRHLLIERVGSHQSKIKNCIGRKGLHGHLTAAAPEGASEYSILYYNLAIIGNSSILDRLVGR